MRSDLQTPADPNASAALPPRPTDDPENGPSATGLTDAHYDWVRLFCGIDPRDRANQSDDPNAGQPNQPVDPNAGQPNQSVDPKAEQANPSGDPNAGGPNPPTAEAPAASGGGFLSSVDHAIDSAGQTLNQAADAAGRVVDAVTRGNPSLTDLAWTAAGGVTHLAAAAAPGGFLAAGAIDSLVASDGSQEQKFWYGVGSTAAGIAETAVGGVEVAGGLLATPETGPVGGAISLEGVNTGVAGAEAMTAGIAMMAGGPGGGSGPAATPVQGANPVSAGRKHHILDGDGTGGGHRAGTGAGKSEFPPSWSDDKIVQEIESVANDPASSRTVQPNGRTRVESTRDGVRIRVIIDPSGDIITGHPF